MGMPRRRGIALALVLVLATSVPVAQADEDGPSDGPTLPDLPDVPRPKIDDPMSDSELEDLVFLAEQEGMSLEAAI